MANCNPNGRRSRRDRSICPIRPGSRATAPLPTFKDIADECMRLSVLAGDCAAAIGFGSEYGKWFVRLSEACEREANLLLAKIEDLEG